jgi:hypothetical protein
MKMQIRLQIILIIVVMLNASISFAQEFIYPNKLLSDSGLIEYRPYTLEEARSLEQGNNNAPIDSPFLLDWGPERRLTEQDNVYFERALTSQDSIFVSYGLIWGRQAYFIRSLDGGINWGPYAILFDSSNSQSYLFPEMGLNNGQILLGCATQLLPYGNNLSYFKSINSGASWSAISNVFPYYNPNISNYSSLYNVGSRIYWSYINYHDYDSIYVLTSTNWGTSWNGRGVNVAYLNGTPQPMTIRASGNNIHLVWVNEEGTINVRYSRSTDSGQGWSPQMDIAADSSGAQEPYIAVQDSHVVVCWMGYKYSPYMFTGDLFIKQSFDNGATWDNAQVLTDLHKVWMGSVYTKDSIIITTWQDDRFRDQDLNSEVYARYSTDYGLSWSTEERISEGDNDSDSPIATSTRDIIHVVWGDRRPEASGLYYRMYDPSYEAIDDKPSMPKEAAILSAYPNPFNSSTTIRYSNNRTAPIEIYNLLGEKIKTIETQGKEGNVIWDGTDMEGRPVSSGVYFAKVSASGKNNCTKLVMIR